MENETVKERITHMESLIGGAQGHEIPEKDLVGQVSKNVAKLEALGQRFEAFATETDACLIHDEGTFLHVR